MLTVFWCSTSYTVIIVLWKMLMEPVNAPARWWPCACLKCVSGLRRLENPWTFWDTFMSDLVLKYGSDINEGNWLQLFFNFIVLIGTVASFVGMSLFHLWVTFQVEVFSYCNPAETFKKGFENRFYIENVNFGSFSYIVSRLVSVMFERTELSKRSASLVLIWRHQRFSISSLKPFLVSSLN